MGIITGSLDNALETRTFQRVLVETNLGYEDPVHALTDKFNLPILQHATFMKYNRSFISTYANRDIAGRLADHQGTNVVALDRDFHAFDRAFLGGYIAGRAMDRMARVQERISDLMPKPRVGKKKLEADGVITTEQVKERIGGYQAQDKGINGDGVKVAVVDTGFAPNRQLSIGDVKTHSSKLYEGGDQDRSGHGTWCITTIGGRRVDVTPKGAPRQLIVDGIAPMAEMLSVRSLYTPIGTGTNADVLKGIQIALDSQAGVISMSLGSDEPSDPDDPTKRLIEDIVKDTDTVLVIAAGNAGLDGPRTVGSPGDVEDALTVGSVSFIDSDESIGEYKRSYYSSYGPTRDGRIKPDVCGWGGGRGNKDARPSESILSSSSGLIDAMDGSNRLASIQGTSMATPEVAAVVALWKQVWLENTQTKLDTAMVKEIIQKYGLEKNNEIGHGPIQYEWIEQEMA
jgi:subtilisin family serine protease